MSMLRNTADDCLVDVTGVASDTVPLAKAAQAFMITAATALKVKTGRLQDDGTHTTVTFPSGALVNGVIYPLNLYQVFVTGTTDLTKVVLFYGKF